MFLIFFPAIEALEPPSRFDNKLLHSFKSVIGMVINFFYFGFSNIWIKFKFLEFFCFKCMDLYEPVKLFQAWNRDTG